MEKEILKKLVDQGLSQYKIAIILNTCQTTIRYWLAKYDLATFRTKSCFRIKTCINCNSTLSSETSIRNGRKYCSIKCQQDFYTIRAIKTNNYSLRTVKRYLVSVDRSCSVCHLVKWNDIDITLELDHIDGNHINNDLSNLRLICPNCHSQTPTYKNKNKGRGRASRMKRYKEGKSY